MGFQLKEKCKHHKVVDGVLVRYNPGDIFDNVPVAFKDKFESVESEARANPTIIKPGAEDHNTPLNPIKMTDSAKKLIKHNDLDPNKIEATGKDDTILKSDVIDYLKDLEEEG